jgi:hypothetical protein
MCLLVVESLALEMPFQRLHDWVGSGFGQDNRIEDLFRFKANLIYFFDAELATRGLAISFLTPASVALPGSFLAVFLGMYPPWYRGRSQFISFWNKEEGNRSTAQQWLA